MYKHFQTPRITGMAIPNDDNTTNYFPINNIQELVTVFESQAEELTKKSPITINSLQPNAFVKKEGAWNNFKKGASNVGLKIGKKVSELFSGEDDDTVLPENHDLWERNDGGDNTPNTYNIFKNESGNWTILYFNWRNAQIEIPVHQITGLKELLDEKERLESTPPPVDPQARERINRHKAEVEQEIHDALRNYRTHHQKIREHRCVSYNNHQTVKYVYKDLQTGQNYVYDLSYNSQDKKPKITYQPSSPNESPQEMENGFRHMFDILREYMKSHGYKAPFSVTLIDLNKDDKEKMQAAEAAAKNANVTISTSDKDKEEKDENKKDSAKKNTEKFKKNAKRNKNDEDEKEEDDNSHKQKTRITLRRH